jgi:hypothetical protein
MNTKRHFTKSLLLLLAMLASMLIGNLALAAEETIPESGTVAAVSDVVYPSDVENVKAKAGDKSITLSWDAATDNVGVKGYKIFYGTASVASDTASYTLGPIDAGNVLTYDVKDLENGKTYYFAVTAYDAANNESEFYSSEVSATPAPAGAAATTTDANDKTAPKVVSAAAPYKTLVKVVFSEAVKLPENKPEGAFSIKDDFLGTSLTITKAELDPADVGGKTVLLTTSTQKKSAKYILTAGIQIQDNNGNPIISGTSDTAVFNGTDIAAPPVTEVKPAAEEKPADNKPATDTVAPSLISVKALDGNTVEVNFSEPVTLLPNATENFIITDALDNTKITNVKKVAISQNGAKATLTTEDLKPQTYNLIVIKVTDLVGNNMEAANSAASFEGVAPATDGGNTNGGNTDGTTKLEDAASNLVAKAMSNMMVNLSWKAKADKMANVANFVVYMSTDRGTTYDDGVVLGKDAKNYNFKDLQSDMVYYFKLTTRDASGKESEGLITYLTLPKTGPGLALLLLGSAGAGAVFTRKKKK